MSLDERAEEPDRPASGTSPPSPSQAPPHVPRPPARTSRPAEQGEAAERIRREILVYRGFVHTLLAIPELEAVIFSTWGSRRADLYIGTRRAFSEPARRELLSGLEQAIAAAISDPHPPREKLFHTEYPFGQGPEELDRFAGVQTSVVSGPEDAGTPLLFTLVFGREPARETRDALTETHRLVRTVILGLRSASRYRTAFRSLVSASIEPGLRPYPQLKRHAFAVALLSRRFAFSLRLPAETVEQVTVAGLLHDVGLRELELPYDRIASRRPLNVEEMAIVRRHPIVAAGLLERIAFPYPIAPLVRHHHERFDGSGYPDRLIGEEIPYGSRLIGLAEAFDAMTSPDSYRPPVSRDAALSVIESRAGTQFDPELASRFCAFVRSEAGGRGVVGGDGSGT